MWSPTHVQVTVQKSRDLLTKGKNGTNDVFVTIALGKEKYQTSVKEKASGNVEWHEECELQIPEHGNTAQVVLTALHRNFLGVDEFLGMASVPLADFDVYERPRNRWYTLKSKPGKEKSKPRGELEVKIAFIVKAGSLTDLSKKEKHKSSLGQLSHMAHSVGGSLLSIGSADKRKSLKRIAKSIGHKVTRKDKKGHSFKEESLEGSGNLDGIPVRSRSGQLPGEADPGVISEGESEDEFTFDDLSHKSSASSLSTAQPAPSTNTTVSNTSTLPATNSLENLAGGEFLRRTSTTPIVKAPAKPPRTTPLPDKPVDEWEEKLFGKQGKAETLSVGGSDTLKRRSWEGSRNILSSQPEIEETQEIPATTQAADVSLNNSTLLESTPVRSHKEIIIETDKPEEKHDKEQSKFARKLKTLRRDAKFSELFPDTKPAVSSLVSASTPYERIIIGGESDVNKQRNKSTRLPQEVMHKFEDKSREELIEMVCDLQGAVEHQQRRMKDMEDYLDNLLLRVMETTPRLLQNPYVTHKTISSSG